MGRKSVVSAVIVVAAVLICLAARADERAATTKPATTRNIFDLRAEEVQQLRERVASLERELAAAKGAGRWAATRPATAPGAVFVLKIAADVDGSDEVHVTREGLQWKHKEWGWPLDVNVNGHEWDPRADLTWEALGVTMNDRTWAGVRAKVVAREGRDTVAVETDDEGWTVYFADSPGGSDIYAVKIELSGLKGKD